MNSYIQGWCYIYLARKREREKGRERERESTFEVYFCHESYCVCAKGEREGERERESGGSRTKFFDSQVIAFCEFACVLFFLGGPS